MLRFVNILFLCIGVANAAAANNPAAFNPALTNLILQDISPTLYYNGSGNVPPYNLTSPVPAPLPPPSASQLEDDFYNQIVSITQSPLYTNCTKCITAVEIMHLAAITTSADTITNLLIRLCNQFKLTTYADTCEREYSQPGLTGPYLAQMFYKMNMETQDMQSFCAYYYDYCEAPPVISIDESQWFSPKPADKMTAPPPSGEVINVLHLSDWHLDPRYDIGSEADCSQYLCCRPNSTNTKKYTNANNATVPASRFGYLYCDTPPDLGLSVFSEMSNFINASDVCFTIFTGDIVSHDNDDQLSRAYVEYEEMITYQTFKALLGNMPVYSVLGNHDSLPEALNTPNSFTDGNASSNIFSWNYDLISSLWAQNGWIDEEAANYASQNYGAYSYVTPQGLKIVSLNSDMWYIDNIYNYYNTTNPDSYGMLSYLIAQLEASEQINQRVWIIAHVPSGYDGTNALRNPTALFSSIIHRFSPATIAAVFFGHTHEDQFQLWYDFSANSLTNSTQRNTSLVDQNEPLMVGWIGPSITPLSGNNAGWRYYQVDAVTFEVVNARTYFANVSEANTWSTPEWKFEYDTRTTYDPHGQWPAIAPLNATFWHEVTNNMLQNQTLVELYNFYETKSSVVTKNCTSAACGQQKVCYLRSGSADQGYACPMDDGPF